MAATSCMWGCSNAPMCVCECVQWGMEKGRKGRKGFEEERKKGGCRGLGGRATDNRQELWHGEQGDLQEVTSSLI